MFKVKSDNPSQPLSPARLGRDWSAAKVFLEMMMFDQESTDAQIKKELDLVVLRMREVCNDIERLADGDRSNETKISRVISKLAWANANATTQLENALNCLETRREVIEAEAANKDKDE